MTILDSSRGSGVGLAGQVGSMSSMFLMHSFVLREQFVVANPPVLTYSLGAAPMDGSAVVQRNGVILNPGQTRDYVFDSSVDFILHPDTKLHPGEILDVWYSPNLEGLEFVTDTFTVTGNQRSFELQDYILLGFILVTKNGIPFVPGIEFTYDGANKTININPDITMPDGTIISARYAIRP